MACSPHHLGLRGRAGLTTSFGIEIWTWRSNGCHACTLNYFSFSIWFGNTRGSHRPTTTHHHRHWTIATGPPPAESSFDVKRAAPPSTWSPNYEYLRRAVGMPASESLGVLPDDLSGTSDCKFNSLIPLFLSAPNAESVLLLSLILGVPSGPQERHAYSWSALKRSWWCERPTRDPDDQRPLARHGLARPSWSFGSGPGPCVWSHQERRVLVLLRDGANQPLPPVADMTALSTGGKVGVGFDAVQRRGTARWWVCNAVLVKVEISVACETCPGSPSYFPRMA